ncbi:MAG: hypothetical protein JW849_09350 [Phycisphaerae bacterium]|nr:hypothetical protein [Phycisphaerae bacterium]
MTSRELAFEALAHHAPERIPYTLYLSEPLRKMLSQKWGPRESWPCPPDDLIRILWDVEDHDVTETGFRDRFDCPWRREEGGYMFINPPLKEPDASQIPRITLIPDKDVERILSTRRRRPDAFIFYQFTATFGERLWCLRGLEQTLMDYLLEPSFVHAALDALMDMHMEGLEKILSLPIDGVTFCDDFGGQRGPMISLDVFRTFFRPRYAKMFEKVRQAGKVVGHHSCGDNTIFLGDLIDIGLQVFHPLQPEAMDIRQVKRQFGKDLTFRGGIGTQGAIVFGTPDEARAEVRNATRILAEDGGYFLETAKPLPEETPPDNVLAVIDELTRVMRYDFNGS